MVDDFQRDSTAKAGMNDRGRDMRRQTQPGLFTSSFDATGQPALDGKRDMFQGSDQDKCPRRNYHDAIRVRGQWIRQADDFREIDVVQVDRVSSAFRL